MTEISLPAVIASPVVRGRGLGHKLGAPTVNQALPHELCRIPYGVYFSTVTVDGVKYNAVSNVGVKPTVTSDGIPVCETHILGAELSLYGQSVTTELLFFRRGEKRFPSKEALAEAITADMNAARKYFSANDIITEKRHEQH